jgi:hypothetical protein
MVSAVVPEPAQAVGNGGDGTARDASKGASPGSTTTATGRGKSLMRESLELAGCAASIYVCFIGYGYLHEMMSACLCCLLPSSDHRRLVC